MTFPAVGSERRRHRGRDRLALFPHLDAAEVDPVVDLVAGNVAGGGAERSAAQTPAPGLLACIRGGAVTPPGTYQIDTKDSSAYLFPKDFSIACEGVGGFHCDWLTVLVPFMFEPGSEPALGSCIWIDQHGVIERTAHRRVMVEGSWSFRVSCEVHACPIFDGNLVRLAEGWGKSLRYLRISGNPVKYFQPHNLFGSSDVYNLAVAFIRGVAGELHIEGQPVLERAYLNRVDATANFDLGSADAAASLVRQMSRFASVSHRRATGFDTSLQFPGRRRSLSVYHKGPEMRVHPPKFCPEWLLEFGDRIVRFEVCSRSESLDAVSMRYLHAWRGQSGLKLFNLWWSFVSRLRFPVMSDVDLSALSPAARRMFGSWSAGLDATKIASRMTVYRHRLAILSAGGPDILLPKPAGDVIEFRRVLSPRLAVMPPGLEGTIYDPRAA